MSRRTSSVLAWAGFALLLVLHVDFWRPQRVVFYLGWIPEELFYRLLWVLLAWGYLLFVCSVLWKRESE